MELAPKCRSPFWRRPRNFSVRTRHALLHLLARRDLGVLLKSLTQSVPRLRRVRPDFHANEECQLMFQSGLRARLRTRPDTALRGRGRRGLAESDGSSIHIALRDAPISWKRGRTSDRRGRREFQNDLPG